MKKFFSFVAAFAVVAMMMVSCASQNDLKTLEMGEAMKANDVAKVEKIVNELGAQDEKNLSGDNKACLVLGCIYLANKAHDAGDAVKFQDYRNKVMGIHEVCKNDPDYVKAANDVKKANPEFDLFDLSEKIKGVILEEAIDAAAADEYSEDVEGAEDAE